MAKANQQQEKISKYLTDKAGTWVSYADIADACGMPLPSARRATQELMKEGTLITADGSRFVLDTKRDTNGTWFQAMPRAKPTAPEATA